MRQFDMSSKELVRTYYFDDIHTNRSAERRSVIKGRTVIELGTRTAASFVGNLYRVYDYSVKSYKQLLLVGVAKQNTDDRMNDELEGVLEEKASVNAWIKPSLKLILDTDGEPFNEDYFLDLCIVMIELMPMEFLLTDEELGNINV